MKRYLWWHWQGNVADSYDHGGFSLWEDSEKGTLFSPLTNRKDSCFWIGINSKLGLGLLLCVCVCVYACMLSLFSHVWLCATLWTIACQAPLSKGFFGQEYWSGLPCPPVDLLNPGIEPTSFMSPALAGRFYTTKWYHIIFVWRHFLDI